MKRPAPRGKRDAVNGGVDGDRRIRRRMEAFDDGDETSSGEPEEQDGFEEEDGLPSGSDGSSSSDDEEALEQRVGWLLYCPEARRR